MYLDDYKRWCEADLEDAALTAELESVAGNDEEIKERFAVALKFGTAGLRVFALPVVSSILTAEIPLLASS